MKRPLPWRAIALFLFVSAVVLATFFLWGERIDAWTQKVVEKAADDKTLVAVILFLVLASDIFLPVPSSIASTACGLVLGPVLGFAVSVESENCKSDEIGDVCGCFQERGIALDT